MLRQPFSVYRASDPLAESTMYQIKDKAEPLSRDASRKELLLTLDNGLMVRQVFPLASRREAEKLLYQHGPEKFKVAKRLSRLALAVSRMPDVALFRSAGETPAENLSDEQLLGCISEAGELSQSIYEHETGLYVCVNRSVKRTSDRKRVGRLVAIHITPPVRATIASEDGPAQPAKPAAPYMLLANSKNHHGASAADLTSAMLFEEVIN